MSNTEVNVQDSTENQEIDYKALYEEANKKFEEKSNKVDELEWLIQKHKTKSKTTTQKSNENDIDIDALLEKKLAEKDFYSKNPEMSEYKEQIQKFTSTGVVSYEQAKVLVMQNDPSIQNREIANKTNFTESDSGLNKTVYTQEDLSKLDPVQFKKVWADKEKGKVKII